MLQDLVGKLRNALTAQNVPTDPGYLAIREHVLARIADVSVGEAPFYHLFIDELFPRPYFEALLAHLRELRTPEKMQARTQDSAGFVNRRYQLWDSRNPLVVQFRALWSDPAVKHALFSKFYQNPSDEMLADIRIHEKEFEFVFSEPGRFQNIHVDIPPKYMSFVFYFPPGPLDEEAEKRNATVLYDRDLKPVYGARFRQNSVCIFVPHFYSYHGFSTTMDRDVMVMFMINGEDQKRWHALLKEKRDAAPKFDGTLDLIEEKLKRNPLIEYGTDPDRIAAEREACRINAPRGRVMID
jgi:hypothetical protein